VNSVTDDEQNDDREHDHSGDYFPACDAQRLAQRNDFSQWDADRERAATIEAILQLHQLCTPPSAIAQRLHLDEATVRYVIQHQEWPQSKLFEGGASR